MPVPIKSTIQPADASPAFVAVGSNASADGKSPLDRLKDAFASVAGIPGSRSCTNSRIYRTPCFPKGAGPDYLNAAIAVITELSPPELLEALHRIEGAAGRQRNRRWGSRTLDLDLLAHGDAVLPDHPTFAHWRDLPATAQQSIAPARLILPHPRMQDRSFVLIPLLDVAPDWRHPVSGLTVRQMVAERPGAEKIAVQAL